MRTAAFTSRSNDSANVPICKVTPTVVKQLLAKGFNVNVERSPVRIFDDKDFSDVGATLVPEGSWPNAPKDSIIIGLKELPEEACTYHTR